MLRLNYRTPDFLTKISLKPQELRWKPKKKNLDKSKTSLMPKKPKVSKRQVRLRTFIILKPQKLVRQRITYELRPLKKSVRLRKIKRLPIKI